MRAYTHCTGHFTHPSPPPTCSVLCGSPIPSPSPTCSVPCGPPIPSPPLTCSVPCGPLIPPHPSHVVHHVGGGEGFTVLGYQPENMENTLTFDHDAPIFVRAKITRNGNVPNTCYLRHEEDRCIMVETLVFFPRFQAGTRELWIPHDKPRSPHFKKHNECQNEMVHTHTVVSGKFLQPDLHVLLQGFLFVPSLPNKSVIS